MDQKVKDSIKIVLEYLILKVSEEDFTIIRVFTQQILNTIHSVKKVPAPSEILFQDLVKKLDLHLTHDQVHAGIMFLRKEIGELKNQE